MNDHKMRDVNIILGASDKDDDYTRWTNDYVKGVIDRIEHEPNNIKFLDPKETEPEVIIPNITFKSVVKVQ